jgi:hypothetical protein
VGEALWVGGPRSSGVAGHVLGVSATSRVPSVPAVDEHALSSFSANGHAPSSNGHGPTSNGHGPTSSAPSPSSSGSPPNGSVPIPHAAQLSALTLVPEPEVPRSSDALWLADPVPTLTAAPVDWTTEVTGLHAAGAAHVPAEAPLFAGRHEIAGPDRGLWLLPAASGAFGRGVASLSSVGRLVLRACQGALGAAGDPRVAGVLRAAPSVVSFVARSRARSALAALDDTVIPVRTTPGLALQAYLDELLIAVLRHPGLLPKESEYAEAADDLTRMRALFAARGWLEHPEGYHRTPPPPDDVDSYFEQRAGMPYDHVTFSSGWAPEPFEPGRERWARHTANEMVHTWVAHVPERHRRTWLVCAHGLGMGGNPSMDLRAFRATQLVRRGINVAVPVLPLHGLRANGRGRGEDLMTIDMVDSLHGVAQAVWDLRRTIRWLRETYGAEQVGVIGYSLGGLVASIVAALEDDLSCVIAGIPVVDLPHLFRRHSPPDIARLATAHGVLGPEADDVHRVVSPLTMLCKVPFERRYIFAGLADRMSTFGHARRLWLHWGRPAFSSYAGGHVGFYWSGDVKRFVDEAISRAYAPPAVA